MASNRRDFLKKGALLSLTSLASGAIGSGSLNKIEELGSYSIQNNLHTLPVLPYAYDALEPFIDQQTMTIHHSKHHQAYITNLNKAIEEYTGKETAVKQSIYEILAITSKLPVSFRNNGGGHFNHSLFWTLMKPNKDDAKNDPSGKIADAIIATFGNFEEFTKQFNDAAMKRFGSGWAWLYLEDKKLKIGSTPNQDNPLMDVSEIKGKPLLALDVWEHAYY